MMQKNTQILIIDDDEMYRFSMALILTESGYNMSTAKDGEEGLAIFKRKKFHIVLVDYRMPGMNGIEFLIKAKKLQPETDIVLLTAFTSIETAVEAIRNGAYDYLAKPVQPDKLNSLVNRIIEKQKLLANKPIPSLNLGIKGTDINIIGNSSRMKEIFAILAKISPTDSTVLIQGESGTGKEIFAKAIHANSLRKEKTFFTMDCGSLVESLFESELFGHVKGSFTGATSNKRGAFELAHGGTFFFDEIGNISQNVQAKILRAIQEKEIRRVGDTKTIKIDVRVIAATNLDLRHAVEMGTFREDLFYRLSVIPIYIPPLRDRKDDIPLLVDYFIKRFNPRRGVKKIKKLDENAMNKLVTYSWPGNIRELQNVIERALVIEDSTVITLASLPANIIEFNDSDGEQLLSLEQMEKKHILSILKKSNHNISKSARILGIDRKTLYEKIRKFNL